MANQPPQGPDQPQNPDRRLDLPYTMAGVGVILAGILFLGLSAAVATAGSWWQSTFDAFGAGLVVGGLVDVLAISWLNRREQRKQQAATRQADFVLEHQSDPDARSMAWDLLTTAGPSIDPKMSKQLFDFIEKGPGSPETSD
jgi:hypothetical protein